MLVALFHGKPERLFRKHPFFSLLSINALALALSCASLQRAILTVSRVHITLISNKTFHRDPLTPSLHLHLREPAHRQIHHLSW